ncbi:MAG: hypothetical protein JRE65_06935 [Deltaproteobacteria bacterium]|nr:hypothetical protein [Deltaproteobacteria bacterium]
MYLTRSNLNFPHALLKSWCLKFVFPRASLFIPNDDGPGQFTALTPIPTIIFYGPETPVLCGTLSSQADFYIV